MLISADVFEAYLDCPTKCWFRFSNTEVAKTAYSQWLEKQNQSHRIEALKRLLIIYQSDAVVAPSQPLNIKKASWRLAADFVARKDNQLSFQRAEERPNVSIVIAIVFPAHTRRYTSPATPRPSNILYPYRV